MDKLAEFRLAEIQEAETRMLRVVHAAASKTSIPYFAAYGTALGAVRDHGPIPWDWDADILVPTEVYDQLLEAIEQDLPAQMRLSRVGDPGYEPLFSRLHLVSTPHAFLHVDIFPLAGAPTSSWGRRLKLYANRVLCRAYAMKRLSLVDRPHYAWHKRAVVHIVRGVVFAISSDRLGQIHARLNSRTTAGANWLTNPVGTYGIREYFRAEWFTDAVAVPYGLNTSLLVPGGYDAYLRHLYGPDYMTPIPVQEQERVLGFFALHVAPHLGEL